MNQKKWTGAVKNILFKFIFKKALSQRNSIWQSTGSEISQSDYNYEYDYDYYDYDYDYDDHDACVHMDTHASRSPGNIGPKNGKQGGRSSWSCAHGFLVVVVVLVEVGCTRARVLGPCSWCRRRARTRTRSRARARARPF